MVAEWVSRHSDKIELFFLLPYAPESNPDEYLNHGLKLSVHTGDFPKNVHNIRHITNSYIRTFQRNKYKVPAFFHHFLVSYACVRG